MFIINSQCFHTPTCQIRILRTIIILQFRPYIQSIMEVCWIYHLHFPQYFPFLSIPNHQNCLWLLVHSLHSSQSANLTFTERNMSSTIQLASRCPWVKSLILTQLTRFAGTWAISTSPSSSLLTFYVLIKWDQLFLVLRKIYLDRKIDVNIDRDIAYCQSS